MSDNSKNSGPSIPVPTDFFNWMNSFYGPMINAGTKVSGQVAENPTADPLTVWKNLSQASEEAWQSFTSQLVATPEFAAGLGRSTSSTAVVREAFQKAVQTYLEFANMPTRADITRLAQQIVNVDGKLDDLDDMLAEADINTLADKLGKVEERLGELDRQAALAKRLDTMEARSSQLDTLADRIDKLGKLDKRLANVEKKLDRLETLEKKLATIEKKLPAPANATPKPKPAAKSDEADASAPAKPRRTTKAKTDEVKEGEG